jgi:hypothetical protein
LASKIKNRSRVSFCLFRWRYILASWKVIWLLFCF